MRERSTRAAARTAGLTRRHHLLLGFVFLVALGMRCGHWWGQFRNNPTFSTPAMDEGKHHEWAQLVASGAGLGEKPYFRAPLYYYLLAGLYTLTGPNVALARALGCILGALTCGLIARLGIVLGGFGVGALAGLIAAVYWPFIYFDTLLLTTGLELFLNVLMLLVLLAAARRATLPLFLLGGVVWGLSAITRPNVLALAPGILAWLWFTPRLPDRRLRRAAAAAAVLGGAAAVVLPVTLRNRLVGGEWVLIATNGGVNFYIGNNPQADGMTAVVPGTRADWDGGYADTHRIPQREFARQLSEGEVSGYWFRRGFAWICSAPRAWLKLTLHKLRLFWSPIEIANNDPIWFHARMSESSVLYWVGFPLVACLGIAGLTQIGPRWRTWSLPILFLLIYMTTVVAFFCPARYRLPVVPVLILLTAQGLAQLPRIWRSRRFGSAAAFAGVACLAGLFLATNPPRPRADYRRDMEGMGHFNLAMHYLRPQRADARGWEKAVEHLRETVRLRPDFAEARAWLGVRYYETGQPEKAAEQFARALATAPADPQLRVFYARFLRVTGRLPEAAAQCRRALELDPDIEGARHELGLTLAAQGRYTQATRVLRAALASAEAAGQTEAAAEIKAQLERIRRSSSGNAD